MIKRNDFMKKQIAVLLSEKGQKIRFTNDNLVILQDDKIINKLSCHRLFCVFILGDITFTSVALRQAKRHGISMIFLSRSFRVHFAVNSKTEGNFLLRERQYKSDVNLEVAKFLVKNKIQNQIKLLKEKRGKSEGQKRNIKSCENILVKINDAKDSGELLGLEGSVAKMFFGDYFGDYGWIMRSPRTKIDITNLLLDIGYTHLFNFVDALLHSYGFDTYFGVYHKTFYQRKSLSCDLVEPFRCIIEKTIKNAYNLGKIKEDDFEFRNGCFSLKIKESGKYCGLFLEEILKRKMDIFDFTKSYYKNFINGEFEFLTFEI